MIITLHSHVVANYENITKNMNTNNLNHVISYRHYCVVVIFVMKYFNPFYNVPHQSFRVAQTILHGTASDRE